MNAFYRFCCLWAVVACLLSPTASGGTLNRHGSGSAKPEPKPPKQDRYVTYFTYEGEKITRQRTPPEKLKGGGAGMIRELEELLEEGYRHLLAARLEPLLSASQRSRITLLQLQVQTARPKWNHTAYVKEVSFYEREEIWREVRREHLRQELIREEREREQLLAERAKRARDSVAWVMAEHWRLRQDSLTAVAVRDQAQADSLAHLAELEAAPTRFVNAAKLFLRAGPSTASVAQAEVLVGSAVEVVRRLPSGWWNVVVDGYQGYLRAEYLVTSLAGITVPQANLSLLRDNEGSAYVKRIPIRPQAQGARKVYICDGKYAYAYHATNPCPGLNNCRAGVYYTIERKARDLGRTPCERCFY